MEVYGTKLYIYKIILPLLLEGGNYFILLLSPILLVETECYSKQLSKVQEIHELPSWSQISPNINVEPVGILEIVLSYTAKR